MALSIGNYEASLTINEFKGVMQLDERENINTDMRYAADATNFYVRDGNLMPSLVPHYAVCDNVPAKIHTAFPFYRTSASSNTGNPIVDAKNRLFLFGPNPDTSKTSSSVYLANTDGFDQISGHTLGSGSYGRYTAGVQFEEEGKDIFVTCNPWYGLTLWEAKITPWTDYKTYPFDSYTYGQDEVLFKVLAAYADRLWGAGRFSAPDELAYSWPYDARHWTPANPGMQPEDGGGTIRIASFDGDGISALHTFGNSLLIFKKHSLWRLTGYSPDEFNIQQQFGYGTLFYRTIVTYNEAVYFLTENGVCVYDGLTVRPFQQNALHNLWHERLVPFGGNPDFAVGTIWKDKYILSFNDGGDNNFTDVAVYDFKQGAWSYGLEGLAANAYAVVDDKLYLVRRKNRLTSDCGIYVWGGTYEEKDPNDYLHYYGLLDWVSPWTDLGAKDILKTNYKLRFWIETDATLTNTPDALRLLVTMETERGSKTRELVFPFSKSTEEVNLRFHLTGKRVRFRIQAQNAGLAEIQNENVLHSWFRIFGGMQIKADTSPD